MWKFESIDVRNIILETYAQILLNQDNVLLSTFVSKHCITIPMEIIK